MFGNTYYFCDMTAKKPRIPKTYKVQASDYNKAKRKCTKQGTTLSNVLEKVVKAIAKDKKVLWIENDSTIVEAINGSESVILKLSN